NASITQTTGQAAPQGSFTINYKTVNFPGGSFSSVPSSPGTYNVLVNADFSGGEQWTIKVNVTGTANTAPPVITSNGSGNTATINVAENSTDVTTVTATDADAGTTLTYSLSGGADQALFTINATNGELTFNSAPDFENPTDANGDNSYEVAVQASDGTSTDNQTIAVTVTDVNEAPNPDAFITTWKTTTAGEGITIPINPSVSGYNYTVDWGDGSISANQTGNTTHTYTTPGTHTVSITGDFPAIQFGNDNVSKNVNDEKLQTIEQWGNI